MSDHYEMGIIGGGPAGLAAALYAARAKRRTLLLEQGVIGGQIATTSAVENYPGFPDGIDGFALAQRMLAQAERFGSETVSAAVERITRDGPRFRLATTAGDYTVDALIYTAGAAYNKLDVPGEAALTGKGVSYCGTCDAAFFRDVPVMVVGGGDSALDEGLFIARFASAVTVVHRRDTLRAGKILQERARAEPKIGFRWETVVEEILGRARVEAVRLRHLPTGAAEEVPTEGVFVFIGSTPNTHLLRDLAPLDAGGHVPVNAWMETAVPGLFAAGDVRQQSARQVASSVGDGATAAIRADQYLSHALPG